MPYRYVADEAFEERTAILEYEGGLSRPIAEEEATRQTRRLTQRPPPEAEPQF